MSKPRIYTGKVLVVDDHPVGCALTAQQLGTAGYAADTAMTGIDGFERFRTGAYAAVITDLHMPGFDGVWLAVAIRAYEHVTGRGRTPIIALTADVDDERAHMWEQAGFDDWLTKPASVDTLDASLQRSLARVVQAADAPGRAPEVPAVRGADERDGTDT